MVKRIMILGLLISSIKGRVTQAAFVSGQVVSATPPTAAFTENAFAEGNQIGPVFRTHYISASASASGWAEPGPPPPFSILNFASGSWRIRLGAFPGSLQYRALVEGPGVVIHSATAQSVAENLGLPNRTEGCDEDVRFANSAG